MHLSPLRRAIAATYALLALVALPGSAAFGQAQSGGAPLAHPQQQRDADEAIHSPSGRAGTSEPSAQTPTQGDAVFVNGALNVPGAPKDSQTVPSKFSERNAALDKLPTMAFPLPLTDAQKRSIADILRKTGAPVATIDAPVTAELPVTVELRDLPAAVHAEADGLNKLKYVLLPDRILLVDPPNRIVVGELKS